MRPRKSHLEIVPREKRSAQRRQLHASVDAKLRIDSNPFFDVIIICKEMGQVVVKWAATEAAASLKVGHVYKIEVDVAGKLVINGNWKLVACREESGELVHVLELPHRLAVLDFAELVDHDLFFRTSCHRVICLYEPEGGQEVRHHMTDLKDFPLSVLCNIHHKDGIGKGFFDFSADSLELNSIDLKVPGESLEFYAKAPSLVFEYNLFSVRYLFVAKPVSVDSDFGILSVSIPEYLVAITARRLSRSSANVPVLVSVISDSGVNEEGAGCITKLSAVGCEIKLDRNLSFPERALVLSGSSLGAPIRANVVSSRDRWVAAEFVATDSQAQKAILDLTVNNLPEPLVAREPSNYKSFVALYETVGYSPASDAALRDRWRHQTFDAWRRVDEVLPGNCIGGKDKGELISSMGTLPMSNRVAYGHSLCAIKTVSSVSLMLDEMLVSLGWVHALPGIDYSGGSFAKCSKFTTRVYVSFQTQTYPHAQWIVHVVRLFSQYGATSAPVVSNRQFEFRVGSIENFMREESGFNGLMDLIGCPYEPFAERNFHSITFQEVWSKETNHRCAVMLDHSSIPQLTASDVFQYLWLFVMDPHVNVSRLVEELRQECSIEKVIQVVVRDGRAEPQEVSTKEKQVPAFWTFTHRDDLGPVIASVHRSVYAVLRKYGEESLSEMVKML